jgi:hypothetical protein
LVLGGLIGAVAVLGLTVVLGAGIGGGAGLHQRAASGQ